MLQEIFEAIRCKSEEVAFLGKDYIVREVDAGSDLKIDAETEKAVVDGGAERAELVYWLIVVNSIYRKEDGMPLFTAADIPALRKASKQKLGLLTRAVDRVNGLNADDNAKK